MKIIVPTVLEITNLCYSFCSHCYLNCTNEGFSLDFGKIEQALARFSKPAQSGKNSIMFDIKSITGGDPFVYQSHGKNLADVIDCYLKFRGNVDVHVDGWHATPRFLNRLKGKNINFYMSYTPFMKGYFQRFSTSFKDLEKITDTLTIDIVCLKRQQNALTDELSSFLQGLG